MKKISLLSLLLLSFSITIAVPHVFTGTHRRHSPASASLVDDGDRAGLVSPGLGDDQQEVSGPYNEGIEEEIIAFNAELRDKCKKGTLCFLGAVATLGAARLAFGAFYGYLGMQFVEDFID
jgi:hypothetical protein